MVVDGARGKKSPGTWETRPGGPWWSQRPKRMHNRRSGSDRESDRPIVAKKRVMTGERRDLSSNTLKSEEEKAAWIPIPLRRNGQTGGTACRRNFPN